MFKTTIDTVSILSLKLFLNFLNRKVGEEFKTFRTTSNKRMKIYLDSFNKQFDCRKYKMYISSTLLAESECDWQIIRNSTFSSFTPGVTPITESPKVSESPMKVRLFQIENGWMDPLVTYRERESEKSSGTEWLLSPVTWSPKQYDDRKSSVLELPNFPNCQLGFLRD